MTDHEHLTIRNSASASNVSDPAVSTIAERISSTLDGLLGRWFTVYVVLCAVVCIVTFIGYSHGKAASLDEVISMTIARQPRVHDIWTALMKGIQIDPPAMHVFVHLLFRAFTDTAQIARIPATFGFLLLCVSVPILLVRHVPPVYAAAGFFLPYATYIRNRATDARPYSLMVGCSALAVLCWDRMQGAGNKRLWRAAFTVSLAAALSTHFFSIFVLFPLALGELVRWYLARKADLWNALCFVIAGIPYIFSTPILFSGARKFMKTFFFPVRFINLYDFFSQSITNFAVILVVIVLAGLIVSAGRLKMAPATSEPLTPQCRALLAVCVGFLLVPFAGYGLAVVYTRFFVPYYHIVALLGVMIGTTLILHIVSRGNRVVGCALFAGMLLHGALVTARGVTGLLRPPALEADLASIIRLAPPGEDIVIASPHDFLAYYEASRHLTSSPLVYLYDIRKPVEIGFSNTLDIVFSDIKAISNARIVPFDTAVSRLDHIYIATFEGAIQEWQFQYLRENLHARIDWVGKTGPVHLYRASLWNVR